MASRLNPQASDYRPIYPTQLQVPPPFIHPPLLAGPPTFAPFSYHLLPPPHLPSHLTPPLPPPPPPHFAAVPLPRVAEEAELNPICVNRQSNVRIGRGTGARVTTGRRGRGTGGGGRRRSRTDFRVQERARGRSSNRLEEETNGGSNWSSLRKHDMRFLKANEYKTTVMIKNIPNEFTRQVLIDFMDNHCMSENQKIEQRRTRNGVPIPISAYDFFYLPIDFKTKKNKGYAFVNFTKPSAVWKFFNAFDSTKWESSDSHKIRKIICARIQGKEALLHHFQKSLFNCETEEFLPICFNPARDGSGNFVVGSTVGRYRGGIHHY